jgi:hypothetical protein
MTISLTQPSAGTVGWDQAVNQNFQNIQKYPFSIFWVAPGDSISAAITAASSGGGGIVWLLPGTHQISAQLNLANDVHIRGSGRTTTKLQRTAEVVILSDNGSVVNDVDISELTLDGGSYHSHYISLSAASTRIKCNRVQFIGGAGSFSTACVAITGGATDVSVEHCCITSTCAQDYGLLVTVATNIRFDCNDVRGVGVYGVYLSSANASVNLVAVSIVGNAFNGISCAIRIETPANGNSFLENVSITGNTIEACQSGMQLIGNATKPVARVVVSGNSVRAGSGNGITLNYCYSCAIAGNHTGGFSGTGILTDAHGTASGITGNTSKDNTTAQYNIGAGYTGSNNQ